MWPDVPGCGTEVIRLVNGMPVSCLLFLRHEIAAARYTVESQLVGVLRHGIEVTKH